MKTTLVGVVGVGLIILISIAGCGGVDLTGLDPDAGAASAAGHDALAMQIDGGGAGATGAAGTVGTEKRPLAAGCSADDQCGSGICAATSDGSRACCTGRPDACNTCIGGYKTPIADGAVTCGTCRAGELVALLPDGTKCGESCGGTVLPTGFGNSSYTTLAMNSTCRAGVCTETVTDCAQKACPSDCTKMYLGCFVNSQGSADSTSSGGAEAVPGAACRCVGASGDFCSAGL